VTSVGARPGSHIAIDDMAFEKRLIGVGAIMQIHNSNMIQYRIRIYILRIKEAITNTRNSG
jgi:hypothetical protein